jgi:two-component system chemotaxis response regulator CheB
LIKVLIVDDSAVVRKVLTEELSKFSDISVIGTAPDAYVAREKIVKLMPDVITLDIEMPRMDGLTFLEKLMTHFPIPVVIVSSLAPENSDNAIKAMMLGAVEIVNKTGSQYSLPDVAGNLVRAIRNAAGAKVFARGARPSAAAPVKDVKPHFTAAAGKDIKLQTTHKIIAIGASTGGTQATEAVLKALPPTSPAIIIVQHMPEGFTNFYAKRLNEVCAIEVREAKDDDYLVPGMALLAPGGKHMLLQKSGARYFVKLKDGPPLHHQKPSIDVLFQSVARAAGKNAVGVILTGMGSDGAAGLLEMRKTGAHTIAQDEKTCVVFGMPKEAINAGAVVDTLPIDDIARAMLEASAK